MSVWFCPTAHPGQSQDTTGQCEKEDTSRVLALSDLADYFGFVQADSCLSYATQAFELSKKLKYLSGEVRAYRSKFYAFNCYGNYPWPLMQRLTFKKFLTNFLQKPYPYASWPAHTILPGCFIGKCRIIPVQVLNCIRPFYLFRENKTTPVRMLLCVFTPGTFIRFFESNGFCFMVCPERV